MSTAMDSGLLGMMVPPQALGGDELLQAFAGAASQDATAEGFASALDDALGVSLGGSTDVNEQSGTELAPAGTQASARSLFESSSARPGLTAPVAASAESGAAQVPPVQPGETQANPDTGHVTLDSTDTAAAEAVAESVRLAELAGQELSSASEAVKGQLGATLEMPAGANAAPAGTASMPRNGGVEIEPQVGGSTGNGLTEQTAVAVSCTEPGTTVTTGQPAQTIEEPNGDSADTDSQQTGSANDSGEAQLDTIYARTIPTELPQDLITIQPRGVDGASEAQDGAKTNQVVSNPTAVESDTKGGSELNENGADESQEEPNESGSKGQPAVRANAETTTVAAQLCAALQMQAVASCPAQTVRVPASVKSADPTSACEGVGSSVNSGEVHTQSVVASLTGDSEDVPSSEAVKAQTDGKLTPVPAKESRVPQQSHPTGNVAARQEPSQFDQLVPVATGDQLITSGTGMGAKTQATISAASLMQPQGELVTLQAPPQTTLSPTAIAGEMASPNVTSKAANERPGDALPAFSEVPFQVVRNTFRAPLQPVTTPGVTEPQSAPRGLETGIFSDLQKRPLQAVDPVPATVSKVAVAYANQMPAMTYGTAMSEASVPAPEATDVGPEVKASPAPPAVSKATVADADTTPGLLASAAEISVNEVKRTQASEGKANDMATVEPREEQRKTNSELKARPAEREASATSNASRSTPERAGSTGANAVESATDSASALREHSACDIILRSKLPPTAVSPDSAKPLTITESKANGDPAQKALFSSVVVPTQVADYKRLNTASVELNAEPAVQVEKPVQPQVAGSGEPSGTSAAEGEAQMKNLHKQTEIAGYRLCLMLDEEPAEGSERDSSDKPLLPVEAPRFDLTGAVSHISKRDVFSAEAVTEAPKHAQAAHIFHGIMNEVAVFRRFEPEVLAVVIKPDPQTEILIHLTTRAGELEASARCDRGDFQVLAAHWPELRRSLQQQGVHLQDLERGGGNSGFQTGGSLTGSSYQQREQSNEQPGASLSADGAGMTRSTRPAAPQNAPTLRRNRLLESWA